MLLELRATWARLTLGQLRGNGLLSVLPVLAAQALSPVLSGRPWPWELLVIYPAAWIVLALLLPLFATNRQTLQFDGRRVRRPGTLQRPVVIPLDELDVPRSRHRTWVDRLIGRQRLWRTDGRRIEFSRVWYPAAEREAFLRAVFAAAEAAAGRSSPATPAPEQGASASA